MRAKTVAIVLGAALLALFGSSSATAGVADHYLGANAKYRTVVVYRSGNPLSRAIKVALVRYVRGTMPRRSGWGMVLTDVSCQPDMNGISHCINAIRMSNGTRVVVRHNHSMHEVPCLTPGERVFVASRP